MQPGATPTDVIRRWGLTSNLFYTWRRQVMRGELGAVPMPLPAFAQVVVVEDAPMHAAAAVCPRRPGTVRRAHRSGAACGTVLRFDEDVGADALRRVLAVLRGR
jgi:transposase-like protein